MTEITHMNMRKDIFTTGQVAQICKVAPRTVTKWFDSGKLKGYRIPGSRDRRIPASELLRFMKSHDIPTDAVEFDKVRILIIDSDWEMAETLSKALAGQVKYDVTTANNNFDAGIVAQKILPHVILLNLASGDIDADEICQNIRANQDLQGTKVVAIAGGINESQADAVIQKGYDGFITDQSDIHCVVRTIEEATAILC